MLGGSGRTLASNVAGETPMSAIDDIADRLQSLSQDGRSTSWIR
jgi:hypothetical protein